MEDRGLYRCGTKYGDIRSCGSPFGFPIHHATKGLLKTRHKKGTLETRDAQHHAPSIRPAGLVLVALRRRALPGLPLWGALTWTGIDWTLRFQIFGTHGPCPPR